ncbi:MAG: GntR family transcriptional regulator [Anaerolineaceae bacterium]|nr:GntR family transcriptional regulator [Anaerolineaceae bacterium]
MSRKIDESLPIPKYYQVFDLLRREIEEGRYPTGAKIPSERTLVKNLGVSRITIVKAVDLLEQEGLIERRQGLGNFVIEHREERISKVITIAFPYPIDSFFTKIIVGATEIATDHDMITRIVLGSQYENLSAYYQALRQIDCDGLILYPSFSGGARFIQQYQEEKQIPIVLIDRYVEPLEADYVIFDDEQAGYALTEELIRKGYRKIAFVPGYELMVTSVSDRMKGYQRALEAHQIPFDQKLIFVDFVHDSIHYALDDENVSALVENFVASVRPDAFVAANSWLGACLIHDLTVLRNKYLRKVAQSELVPTKEWLDYLQSETGVASVCADWHDIRYQKLQAVTYQDGYDLGVIAARLLIDRLEGRVNSYQHIRLPMSLHVF